MGRPKNYTDNETNNDSDYTNEFSYDSEELTEKPKTTKEIMIQVNVLRDVTANLNIAGLGSQKKGTKTYMVREDKAKELFAHYKNSRDVSVKRIEEV